MIITRKRLAFIPHVLLSTAFVLVATSCVILSVSVSGTTFPGCFSQTNAARGDEIFRVAREGDDLVIPVRVAGAEVLFEVDTANGITTVDTNLAKAVGPKTRTVKTFDGHEFYESQFFRAPQLTVGRLDTQIPEVGVVDLTSSRRVSGYRISGSLGMDFLESHVLSIDYDRGELRLHQSPASAEFVTGFRKRCVLTHNPNTVVIYNKLPGKGVNDLEAFVVDTGLSLSLGLREELFDALVQSGAMVQLRRQESVSATKTRVSTTGSLENFEFAGIKHPSLRCIRLKMNLIGQGLLARYQVTMDFPRGEIWFRHGARIDLSDPVGIPGIGVERAEDNTVVVGELEPGNIGEKAGIALGDELLKINGEDVSKLTLFQIRMKFTKPGECRLKLRREGKVREQILQLVARKGS